MPLAGLTLLHRLDLEGTRVSDVAFRAGLTALLTLNLMNTRVTDVSLLAGPTALRVVDLRGTRVTNSSPVAKVPHLHLPKSRSAGEIVSRVLRWFSQRKLRV